MIRRRVDETLGNRLGIDARALAALRVSLATLVLADLLDRARDLGTFYTDAGVLPRAALREGSPWLARISIHTVSGELWAQALLFSIAGVVALALFVGYRTRLATGMTFLLLVSLHARNPVLLNAGDSLLRRLLLLGMFLPLGRRWSVDAARSATALTDADVGGAWTDGAGDGPTGHRVATLASAALLIQVVVVYTVNGAFKLRGDVWPNGTALLYVFELRQWTGLFGHVLAGYPTALRLLGWLWLGMVLSSVLLILLSGRARALLAGLFGAMHLGMALTMRLGLFPFISMAALLPFLPWSVWDRVEPAILSLGRRSRRLSPGAVWAALGRTALRRTALGRTALGRTALGRTALGRTALGRTALTGPSAGPELSEMGRLARKTGGRLAPVVVAVFLVVVLVWNAASLGYVAVPDGGLPADPDAHRWDMFAPSPPRAEVWYVVPGRLESGRRIDAFHRRALGWDWPSDGAYPTFRWLEYLTALRQKPYAGYRENFAAYLCRHWNDDHADELVSVTVYLVRQPTRLDGPDPTRRVKLLQHTCAGKS